MNSKFLLFVFICVTGFTFGCGVKAPPAKYPETMVDSYIQGYTGSAPSEEELERIRTQQAIDEKNEKAKEKVDEATLIKPTP